MFVTRCSITLTTCARSPGACVVDMTVRAFLCDTDLTGAAQIHGRPMNEHSPHTKPTTNKSKLYPAPLRRLFSFLFNTMPVSSVSMNKRMLTKTAGITAANIHPTWMPAGPTNHPRFSCSVG